MKRAEALTKVKGMKFEPSASALEKWHPEFRAAADNEEATINIYSVIGEDYFTGDGMTAKIVNSILRKNKGKAINVNINSPGGDFFEGTAIYNLLREHDGDINVRVIGLAASAASVVAMAGDSIEIAESGFLMIHNSWTIAMGNTNDMADVSDTLAKFDISMAGVYSKQSGIGAKEIHKMMDAETWIQGNDAVQKGFATALLKSDQVSVDEKDKAQYSATLRRVDVELARAGVPRSERRSLIKDLTSTPGAADITESTMPSAGQHEELSKALSAVLLTVKQ